MNKHTVICPDGKILTRNSKTKKYSHCVVVWIDWKKEWVAEGWASRSDLAHKVLNQLNNLFNNRISYPDAEIRDYYEIRYGNKLQCKILEVTTA